MSERDRSFADSVGMSVTDVARALGRSRQAVNRGFLARHDYLRPSDLALVVGACRHVQAKEQAARDAVQKLYPDLGVAVLKLVDSARNSEFVEGAPGEYWFVCPDFLSFRANLTACAEQLDSLCVADGAEVKFFVTPRDVERAKLFAEDQPATEAIPCERDLRLMPYTLLRIDRKADIDVFCVTEDGFSPLSKMEASRLRLAIEDLLL